MEIQLASACDASPLPDWMVLFILHVEDEKPIVPTATPAPLREIVDQLHESGDLPTKKGELRKLYHQTAPLAPRILIVCVGSKKDCGP